MTVYPRYAYGLDALAAAQAASGHHAAPSPPSDGGRALNPLPQYVASLGDLYARDGPSAPRRTGSTR